MSYDANPTKVVIFKGNKVRKTLHNNEWWFSVVDVCGVYQKVLMQGLIGGN